MSLDFSAVMGGIHGARGQFRNLLHLLAKRPSATWTGCQTGKDVKRFEYPRDDGYIASCAASNLVEGVGQQAFKIRAFGDHAQFPFHEAVR